MTYIVIGTHFYEGGMSILLTTSNIIEAEERAIEAVYEGLFQGIYAEYDIVQIFKVEENSSNLINEYHKP